MDEPVEYRYSERGVIRKGELFRARGGPTHNGSRVGEPGIYKLIGIEYGKKDRVYLLAQKCDRQGIPTGGSTLLYVKGKPYKLASLSSWVVRTYRVYSIKMKDPCLKATKPATKTKKRPAKTKNGQ